MLRSGPRHLLLGLALVPAVARAQGAAASLEGRAQVSGAPAPDRAGDGAAPAIGGSAGLLRMRTSAVGPDGSFRFGLHTEMFSKSDFLVEGDEHNRFVGTLVLAGTPMDWLETWFFTQSSSNENTARRAEAGGDVILALGDFGFGGKGRFGGKSFSGGPETNLRFLNSVGGTTPKLSATNWYLGAVATLDPTDSGFPARAHLNVGYQVDRSRNLCPTDGACSEERFPEPVERMVEEFGQGLNRSRFQLAIGGDVPMTFDGGVFRLWPLLEYHVDVATGEPDEGYDAACDEPGSAFSQICHLGRDSQTLLLGARARPAPGLFVDVGVEFGLASPGAEYGPTPAVPLYNVVLGVSYAHDPGGVVSTAQRPAPAATASRNMGRLRGVVLDAKTGDPIEGAVVVFTGKNLTGLSTDPDGGFLSYEFESGPLALSVRHASYHSAKAEVAIVAGKDLPLEVRLKPDETAPVAPDAPATGATTLSGKVTDPSGGALRAVVRIQGAENREIETDAEGAFAADLPPGDYLARFEAADFLAKEQSFRIEEGRTQALDVVLSKRPSTPRVQISGNRIVLKGKVHFGSRNARLRPDSGQILDEVADLLLAHPEVARVRVEGHTDNRGNKRANQKLSQQRAEAVRNHLVQRGVSGERLEAVGYGASKPLVPNLGERNREKNRRVELRILN